MEINGIKLANVQIIKWPDENGKLWLVENTGKDRYPGQNRNEYFPIGELSKVIDKFMEVETN